MSHWRKLNQLVHPDPSEAEKEGVEQAVGSLHFYDEKASAVKEHKTHTEPLKQPQGAVASGDLLQEGAAQPKRSYQEDREGRRSPGTSQAADEDDPRSNTSKHK